MDFDVAIFQHNYAKLERQGFFVESEIYWNPGSDCSSIYEQLAEKRYREIPRQQIKYVKDKPTLYYLANKWVLTSVQINQSPWVWTVWTSKQRAMVLTCWTKRGSCQDIERWSRGNRKSEVSPGGSHHGAVSSSQCSQTPWSGYRGRTGNETM